MLVSQSVASAEATLRLHFARHDGEADATRRLMAAKVRAEACAAKFLAAHKCPADLIEWGRLHGIPTFAEVTWQAGFLAGMRIANLADVTDA
jgi:hypothetical protein